MIAKLRNYRLSPKKANIVAELVRKKHVVEAVNILKFTNKKMAQPLKKLIQSATANAENNFKQNKETLYVKEIIVNEGPTIKRHIPISKGRVHPIKKRSSHITVKLETKVMIEEEIKEKKNETKKTNNKTTNTQK